MAIFILMATILNFQYTRTENYNKCISEKTKSSYCKSVIDSVGKDIAQAEKNYINCDIQNCGG